MFVVEEVMDHNGCPFASSRLKCEPKIFVIKNFFVDYPYQSLKICNSELPQTTYVHTTYQANIFLICFSVDIYTILLQHLAWLSSAPYPIDYSCATEQIQ